MANEQMRGRAQGAPWRSSGGVRRSAFTLIELLLVVAISLIAVGIAVPMFAKSFQGSQLRTAARNVVMSVKYTRSMAVLKQHYMAILFDRVAGSLEVVSLADRAALAQRSQFISERGEGGAAAESGPPPIRSDLRKPLPKDIKIVSFESAVAGRALDDVYWVNFFPNGMGEGFVVELEDKAGKRVRIRVEGISGSAEVEFL